MAFLVQKFGGTSVADPAARERVLFKVAEAVKAGDQVAVVVSAMGRKGAPYATDTLLGVLDEAAGKGADAMIRDFVAACGETISAGLVAAMLKARGVDAVPLSAYTAGVSAEGPYGDAEVSSVDPSKVRAVIDSGKVPVITGFQAVAPDGSLTTIGRGGSDTSAVAVGAWAKADFVDIYTDVPGVASADPRVVPEAPFLARLDYRSMYRLAANGARVLHDRSALLGERFGVKIRVRSTFDDGLGTLISAEPLPDSSPVVLGVASSKDGADATVAVVCRPGTARTVSTDADSAAARLGAKRLPDGADADALRYACKADAAPELVRALFQAVGAR